MKKMLKTTVLGLIALLALAMIPAGFASEYGTELTKTDFYVTDATGSTITLSVATQNDGNSGNNNVGLTIDGVSFGTVTIPDEPHASYDFITIPLAYLDSMLTSFAVVAGNDYTLSITVGSITDSITIHINEAVPT